MKSWTYYLPRVLPPRKPHEQPWLASEVNQPIKSYKLPSMAVAAFACTLVSIPLWYLADVLEERGNPDAFIFFWSLIFFEVLFVLVAMFNAHVQKGHDSARLEILTLPGEIGGKFKILYRVQRGADTKYRIALVCTRKVAWFKPKNLFQQMLDVEATEFTATGSEALIPAEFDIPAHLPETETRSYWNQIEWSLMIMPQSMFQSVGKLFTYIDPSKFQNFTVPIYRLS